MASVDLAKLVSTHVALTKSDIRIASVLSQHVDHWGEVRVMQQLIMEEASVSQATLTRSLRRLEETNFISTTRVRKEFNRYGKNRYTVKEEYMLAQGPSGKASPIRAGWPETPIAQFEDAPFAPVKFIKEPDAVVITNEQSTASPSSSNGSNESNNQLITSNNYLPTKNYLKSELGLRPSSSEMSNGKDSESKTESADPKNNLSLHPDSNPSRKAVLGGWGTAKRQINAGMGAKHWKTRHFREKATWTAWDISAEFQVLLNEESKRTVGHVDGGRIRGIVNKLRKERGSFAELEIYVARDIARNLMTLGPITKDVGAAPGVFYNVLNEYIDLWWEAEDPEEWQAEFIRNQQAYDKLFNNRDQDPIAWDARLDRLLDAGQAIQENFESELIYELS